MNMQFLTPQGDLSLRDIHMPPSPPWWPPAPGWWALAISICVVITMACLFYRQRKRQRRWRERVLVELQALEAHHAGDDVAYATSLHQLLRRATLRYAPDAHQLQGARWRETLARVSVDAATIDRLMSLEARMYQPRAEFDRNSVQEAAHRWLLAALRHADVTKEAGHA
jgi:hypothetical protein